MTATLRTFLIADVRGYTLLTEEHDDEEGAKVAKRFAVLARRGLTDHGELVELRGDEALGAFGSARDARRAAVELQRLFHAERSGTRLTRVCERRTSGGPGGCRWRRIAFSR